MITKIKSYQDHFPYSVVFRNKLLRASFISAAGTFISGLINFYVAILVLRHLSFADISTYAGLFSVIGLFTFLSPAIHLYFVKLGSFLKNNASPKNINTIVLNYSLKILCGVAIFAGILLLIQQRNPHAFFFTQNNYLWFVIVWTGVGLLQPIIDGLLRGLQKFTELTLLSLVSITLKAIVLLYVLFLTFSLTNILLGALISIVGAYGISLFYIAKLNKSYSVSPLSKHRVLPRIIPFILFSLTLNSLINSDLIILKHFLDPNQAGIYAAQINIARIVLYANSVIVPILFSISSELALRSIKSDYLIIHTIAITIGFSISLIVLMGIFSDQILWLFTHKSIVKTDNILWVLATAMGFYSLGDVLVHYLFSHNYTKIVTPLITVCLFHILMLSLFHRSLLQVVYITLTVQGIFFLITAIFYIRYWHISKLIVKTSGI